jgi:hypothetical protein
VTISLRLLLIKADISRLWRNATDLLVWSSMELCKQHLFPIQWPTITRKRSIGYRGLQNIRGDRPSISTLQTKSGMERGISVTSLECKIAINNRKKLMRWNFTRFRVSGIYIQAGRRDATHSFSPSKWKKTKFTSSNSSYK